MFVISGASRQGNADSRLGISAAPVWSPPAKPEELHPLVMVLFLGAAAAAAAAVAGNILLIVALLAPQAEGEGGGRRRRGIRTRKCMACLT